MSHPVKAVLFDLDGTLFDRSPCFSAWAHWFARNRLELSADQEIEEAVSLLTRLDAGGYGSKEAMFRSLMQRYPHLTDEVNALVVAFREQLLVHLPPLDDGTASLLGALKRAGLSWGIVTNGSGGQLGKVRKLGLEAAASCVVVSELVGVRKPAPAIFRVASAQVGVAPANILFVGDDPVADIVGAARVGMQTMWLRRARDWPPDLTADAPHYVVDSLAELLWVLPDNMG